MQTLAHTKTFFQDLLSQEKEEKKRKLPIFQMKSRIKIK